jgi:uncharacterized protein (TIGR02145 family)
MKKIFLLITALCLINSISAQYKTLTLYYPGDSTSVVSIANLDSMVIFICGVSKVSYGGKDYNTVLIGNQCWLKENLNVGTMITSWPDNNSVVEKYCYDHLPANCETYGGLYMWGEAMQYVTNEGAQGICPTGWHIPTEAQYQELITFANNDGNALKREDQGIGSGQGTNTSGFSALLAGGKGYSGGPFYALGDWGSFWMSKGNTSYAYTMQVLSDTSIINTYSGTMVSWGMSVRCIKD